jgi:hypothetical protein
MLKLQQGSKNPPMEIHGSGVNLGQNTDLRMSPNARGCHAPLTHAEAAAKHQNSITQTSADARQQCCSGTNDVLPQCQGPATPYSHMLKLQQSIRTASHKPVQMHGSSVV